MILWLLGGTGVFLLYAAYINQQPQALITALVNGEKSTAPISNYTTGTVPTVTTPDGKTYNTAPGDGGYITTEPPTPSRPNGTDKGKTGVLMNSRGEIYGVVNT